MTKRPVGVTILAVLAYVGSAFSLLFGLALIFGSVAISALLAKLIPQYAAFAGAGAVLFTASGIAMLGLGVLDYFIGKGLWRGKNWARIFVLVLAAISLLGSLWPLSISGLAIGGIIIWYLGFYKPAIIYFK